MQENFRVFDFHRMFLGDAPLTFLLEIIFRTVIMYLYTIVLLRFLGKRGIGQLSTLELAIIICFGSAVGDPMIGQDIPMVYGAIAITTVAFLQVGLERIINKNKKLESIMEGKPDLLVQDGIIINDALTYNNLSHADLFRILRGKDVQHLGEIDKAFFETSGQITVWYHPSRKIRQGLSIIPEEEMPPNAMIESPAIAPNDGVYSCCHCGQSLSLTKKEKLPDCNKCNSKLWVNNSVINAM